MMYTKRSLFILITVMALLLFFAVTASATKPEQVAGYVPLYTYIPLTPEGTTVYGVCDPYLVGMVEQPAETPSKAVHGIFTSSDLPEPPDGIAPCPYTTDMSGTCEIILIPVEDFGNPESKLGRGKIGQCTEDLYGLHGTYKIHYDFAYDAWYHFDP